MKCDELNKLTPYRITKKSSDGTFLPDDIIWVSDGGEVNSVHGGDFIYPEEGDSSTWDFEAELADDWEVISVNGNEFCRKIEIKKHTNHEKLSKITGSTDPVDVAAVKMLLGRIQEDYDRDLFGQSYEQYLPLYKAMKDWLNSEVEE